MTEDEMVGWIMDTMDMSLSKLGQESLACCSPWGCKESDTTGQLNKTNKKDWDHKICS